MLIATSNGALHRRELPALMRGQDFRTAHHAAIRREIGAWMARKAASAWRGIIQPYRLRPTCSRVFNKCRFTSPAGRRPHEELPLLLDPSLCPSPSRRDGSMAMRGRDALTGFPIDLLRFCVGRPAVISFRPRVPSRRSRAFLPGRLCSSSCACQFD